MSPKTEKDFLPKVSREKRGTVSNEVSRERSVLEGLHKFQLSFNPVTLNKGVMGSVIGLVPLVSAY